MRVDDIRLLAADMRCQCRKAGGQGKEIGGGGELDVSDTYAVESVGSFPSGGQHRYPMAVS